MKTTMNLSLKLPKLSALAGTVAVLTSTANAQYVFQGLTPLPGRSGCYARAVNADGRVVVGSCSIGGVYTSVRWVDGVPQELDNLPGGRFPNVYGVSDDGSTMAGYAAPPSPAWWQPVRWDSNGSVTPVTLLPGRINGSAYGISGDGSTVVGGMGGGGGSTAFRQFADGTVQDLNLTGGSSWAMSTNHDGSVVVGSTGSRGFRWTEAGGMEDIGTLATGSGDTTATSISSDGLVIVGNSANRAFRWTRESGMVNYGILPDWYYSTFEDTNNDGSVMVGFLQGPNNSSHAMAYFPTLGRMVDLNTYLPTLGINLAGWNLYSASGVSADGRTIVGGGTFNGVSTGWSFTIIPTPGTLAIGIPALIALRRRRSH